MTELEDALGDLEWVHCLADRLASAWEPWGLDAATNGREAARILHGDYPESAPAELLQVSRASGVIPTEHELEGWEQFWIELGLDSQPEVEQTTEEEDELSGWHQRPLPGLESM